MAKKLTRTVSVGPGDLFVLFKTSAGDYRGAPANDVLEYLQENLVFPSPGFTAYVTQYASPSATGFNVTISDGVDDDENVHLILTPTAGYAAGTITLPPIASVIDKQEILVNCTQQVTTLTVAGNGAVAVTGAPSTLGADDFFRLKYDILTQTWYRVG